MLIQPSAHEDEKPFATVTDPADVELIDGGLFHVMLSVNPDAW